MTTNTREIKFRAWDDVYERMVNLKPDTDWWYGCDSSGKDNHHMIFRSRATKDCCYDRRMKDVHLMQYTGLKDKNGKEIYEGDVLETRLKTFTFRAKLDFGWSRDDVYGLHWTHNTNRRGVGSEVRKVDGISERMEIIGNIYENSDLLV